jgi:hypothetical protein
LPVKLHLQSSNWHQSLIKYNTVIPILKLGLTEVVLKLYLREVVIIAFEVFLKNSITIGSKCEKQENNTCL